MDVLSNLREEASGADKLWCVKEGLTMLSNMFWGITGTEAPGRAWLELEEGLPINCHVAVSGVCLRLYNFLLLRCPRRLGRLQLSQLW